MSVRHRSKACVSSSLIGFGDRLRARRVESHARQRELEQLEQVGLVVDDQHLRLSAIADSAGHIGCSPYF